MSNKQRNKIYMYKKRFTKSKQKLTNATNII